MDWSTLLSVVTINILLSSDNALAIAIVSQRLEPKYRQVAVRWGSLFAVLAQIIMTCLAAFLLKVPLLKVLGGLVLAWIAVKMVSGDENGEIAEAGNRTTSLFSAIRMIVTANLVMCLDNVLAVAAIAGNNPFILGLGIGISFPIIMGGSKIIARLLDRYTFLVWLGSVFLGWTAGAILASDILLAPVIRYVNISSTAVSAFVALGVSFIAWRQAAARGRRLAE